MLMPPKVIQILRTSFSRWGNRGPGREAGRVAWGKTVALCGAVLRSFTSIGHLSFCSWLAYGSGHRKVQGWRVEAHSPEGQQGGGSPLDCDSVVSGGWLRLWHCLVGLSGGCKS